MAGGRRRNSGPPPKPTRLKLLQGNPGHRPLNLATEPQPKPLLPKCPRELGAAAKREWKRVAPELYRLGLLTTVDRACLSGYCSAWGSFIELSAAMRNMAEPPSPAMLRAIRGMGELMLRFATEFGMTPSSRTRTRVAPPGEPLAADEAFLLNRGLKLVE
jgi:phage terminase small subunit